MDIERSAKMLNKLILQGKVKECDLNVMIEQGLRQNVVDYWESNFKNFETKDQKRIYCTSFDGSIFYMEPNDYYETKSYGEREIRSNDDKLCRKKENTSTSLEEVKKIAIDNAKSNLTFYAMHISENRQLLEKLMNDEFEIEEYKR